MTEEKIQTQTFTKEDWRHMLENAFAEPRVIAYLASHMQRFWTWRVDDDPMSYERICRVIVDGLYMLLEDFDTMKVGEKRIIPCPDENKNRKIRRQIVRLRRRHRDNPDEYEDVNFSRILKHPDMIVGKISLSEEFDRYTEPHIKI